MKTFNSYQDLQAASSGDFPKAIASGTPAELTKAAETAMEKNGMVITAKPVTMNVSQFTNIKDYWNQLVEESPEDALSQLADDDSELCRAINIQASIHAEDFANKLKASLVGSLPQTVKE